MGCPSAAIVIEELVQLGVKKLLRVGTCGGLQPERRRAALELRPAAPGRAVRRRRIHEEHARHGAPQAAFGITPSRRGGPARSSGQRQPASPRR
jgi:purine-nucleoside phosphorylase